MFRKYIALLVSLKPLAPELSAWCTLQKMRNLNGYSLLCTSLDSDIRCHFVFSESHCTLTAVIFQCQELQAKYACLKKYDPLQMVHFQPLQLLTAHTGTEWASWWTANNLCPCLFTWSSFMTGSKEHHPPEIQFKSHPANCKVHIPQQVKVWQKPVQYLCIPYSTSTQTNGNKTQSMSMKNPQQWKKEGKKEIRMKDRRGKKIEMVGGKDDRNKKKGPTLPSTPT